MSNDKPELPSQFTDSQRLDWLEAEMDREHNTSGYRSLFRRNVPITREAIDEMMRERLPGDAPEISAAEEWSRDLQAAAGKTVHPIFRVSDKPGGKP